VCPCECFYQDDEMLYIDPEHCIDCEACVGECPVDAIFHETSVPGAWAPFIQLNAERVSALKGSGGHITERQEPREGPGCRGRR
jgi:ferredoxin